MSFIAVIEPVVHYELVFDEHFQKWIESIDDTVLPKTGFQMRTTGDGRWKDEFHNNLQKKFYLNGCNRHFVNSEKFLKLKDDPTFIAVMDELIEMYKASRNHNNISDTPLKSWA